MSMLASRSSRPASTSPPGMPQAHGCKQVAAALGAACAAAQARGHAHDFQRTSFDARAPADHGEGEAQGFRLHAGHLAQQQPHAHHPTAAVLVSNFDGGVHHALGDRGFVHAARTFLPCCAGENNNLAADRFAERDPLPRTQR